MNKKDFYSLGMQAGFKAASRMKSGGENLIINDQNSAQDAADHADQIATDWVLAAWESTNPGETESYNYTMQAPKRNFKVYLDIRVERYDQPKDGAVYGMLDGIIHLQWEREVSVGGRKLVDSRPMITYVGDKYAPEDAADWLTESIENVASYIAGTSRV